MHGLFRASLLFVSLAACGDTSHVLMGQYYLEDRDCLGTSSSIDVVSGDQAATNCAPTCLVQRSYDAARPVYVTTTCPPFSPDTDATGADPRCARALAALARGDTCFVDGGSSHPPAKDAGVGDAGGG